MKLLESFELIARDSGGVEHTTRIDAGALTVFVGPNNSGKSFLLQELRTRINEFGVSAKLLGALTFRPFSTADDLFAAIGTLYPRIYTHNKTVNYELRGAEFKPQLSLSQKQLKDSFSDQTFLANTLAKLFYVNLDGENRLRIVQEESGGDLQGPPRGVLHALAQNSELRKELRTISYLAFGRYLVVDPTGMLKFRLRLSKREPADEREEIGIDPPSVAFHKSADPVLELSDGVKAYLGIILALYGRTARILTIDEPEAFLHPPLARQLGHELGRLAVGRDANIFISTHSADFLSGCVDSLGATVVRLTYSQDGLSTHRVLPRDRMFEMMTDPLLRTSGVISGLFHEAVVVTEGAADRAFYDEINIRLARYGTGGISSTLYLNSQNKQTLHRIAGPLRTFGVPAAMIADTDFVKPGPEFTATLRAASVPAAQLTSLGNFRGDLYDRFKRAGMEKMNRGVSSLPSEDKAAFEQFTDQLAVYGIFVVPDGALESWFPEWNLPSAKNEWIVEVFNKLGPDPTREGYVKPGEGGPWHFVREMNRWLLNPRRLGMPA